MTDSSIKRRLLIAILIMGSLVTGVSFASPARSQEDLDISLIGLESGFPEIRANLRMTDGQGRVPDEINPNSIEVYENGVRIEEFELLVAQNSPQIVAVLVDSGVNTTYERDYGDSTIRLALGELVTEGYIESGVDRVLLTERINSDEDQTLTLISADSQNIELPLALRNISFLPGQNPTEGFVGLEDVLTQLNSAVGEEHGTPTALIYFVHNVNWPPETQQARLARAVSDQARAQGTRIYVVHANPLGGFPDPLQLMAENTGGLYINLAADDMVSERLTEIYEDLEPQSQTYTLRFNSQVIEPGEREIAIVPAGVPVGAAEAIGSIRINPPPANILVETSRTVVRSIESTNADGEVFYSPDSVPVLARVESWPYPLTTDEIELVELLINGEVADTLDAPDPENIIFQLDVSDKNRPETLLVQVELTDKAGLSFKSLSSQVEIEVEMLAPTETPAPTATIAPTATPMPTPFVVVETPEVDPVTRWLPWVLTGFMFLSLLGFGAFFVRRLNGLEAGVARRAFETGGLLNLTRTIITGPVRGDKPIARLVVLQGPADLVDQSVDIVAYNINIGRDPRQCDILLYDSDEHSSISSLHCVIQYDNDQFKITDGSSNGTKLNNTPLQNDIPTPLNDQDELILGDLFRRGAKLRFEIVDPEDVENSAVEEAKKEKTSLANLNVVQEGDEVDELEPIEVGDEEADQKAEQVDNDAAEEELSSSSEEADGSSDSKEEADGEDDVEDAKDVETESEESLLAEEDDNEQQQDDSWMDDLE
ncbi:MAG: FHA domain-containing protein [Chloroflexota bacterium]